MKLLNSFALLICLLSITACADKITDDLTTTKKTESPAVTTTTIDIVEGQAGVNLPNSNGGTRAAVTMDEMFKLTEDNDFETDAYLIKADENESKNDKRVIGLLTFKWNKKNKAENGYKLFTYSPTIEVKWLNGNGGTLKKGEQWYICGVVGGTKETENNGITKSIAFGYPSGNKFNASAGGGKRLFNIPFVANWVPVTIKSDNRISFKDMNFQPQGVVLKVKVERNPELGLAAEDHVYQFSSTELSPNAFLTFVDYTDDMQRNKATISHNNPVTDYWRWYYPTDKVENKSLYEYRHTYKGSTDSKAKYDEFYVWGMPIQGGEANGNKIVTPNSTTTITAAHGGYMLGWLKGNKVNGQFICGKKDGNPAYTSEYTAVDWSKWGGKVLKVNLKETHPQDPKYKWLIPLERFAKSNLRKLENGHGPWEFTGNVTPDAGDGNFKQQTKEENDYTVASLARWKAPVIPKGYHMPGISEMTAAFPYLCKRFDANWNENMKASNGWNLHSSLEAYGYVAGQDIKRPNADKSEVRLEGNYSEWLRLGDDASKAHLFNSVYKIVDQTIDGVLTKVYYAIRFAQREKKDNGLPDPIGNRYRCAYRYIIHTKDKGWDNRGYRMSVTARWLGNLPVTIDDVATQEFWNKNNSADVIRIFNRDGQVPGAHKQGVPYASKTHYKVRNQYSDNDPYETPNSRSITAFYRVFDTSGFYRDAYTGHSESRMPIRCMANWDLDENADNAPRKQKIESVNGQPAEVYYK